MKRNAKRSFSVIVPAYNAAKNIGECLDSILSEKYDQFEVIVVNDGSVDDTSMIVKKILKRDGRVKLIEQENAGVSVARNVGIKQAKGEYIMFVDADDKLGAGWGKIMDYVSNEDLVIFSNKIDKRWSKKDLLEIVLGYKKAGASICGPFSKLCNRKFILENNILFDKNIINGEDMIFNIEAILKTDNIGLAEYSFYDYRFNLDSATKKYDEKIINSDKEFHKRLARLTEKSENLRGVREYSLQMGVVTIAERLAFAKDYGMVKEKYSVLETEPYSDAFNRKCLLSGKAKVIFMMLKHRRYYAVYTLISLFYRKRLEANNKEVFERI